MMDDLAALRLQIEWGADEALLEAPVDRFAALPAQPGARSVTRTPARPGPAAPATPPGPPATGRIADLAALHAALDASVAPLRVTASHTVAPSGNPAAGLVLVGEAPGPDDDRAGQAYSGALGASLDRVLGSAGLGREALLLAFLVPWRPPGGRPVNQEEVAFCLPYLHRLLALAAPRRIVLLGGGPARALLGPDARRGRWTQATIPGLAAPVPAMPMLAPDRWLQGAASRQNTWADLLTLREALG